MKAYLRLAAFGAVAAMLTACSRASYPSSSAASVYPGLERVPAKLGLAAVAYLPNPTLPAPPPLQTEASIRLTQPSRVVELPSCPALEGAPASAPRPARLVLRLLAQQPPVKRVAAQLRKVQVARWNAARIQTRQELSDGSRAALLALIGLILLAIVLASTAHTVNGALGLLLLSAIGGTLVVAGVVSLLILLINKL